VSRTVVWFSCGAASACAAALAVEHGENVHVVYCDTLAEEHPDNARFLTDVEAWIGRPIEIIRSEKYSSISDVFEKTRYMAGIGGARCTVEMKKVPRFAYQKPDDLHVFGLTFDEQKRIERFEGNNPELRLWWVLKEWGLAKDDCYTMLENAGIALPVMYSLGFENNNCIGCVKATSAKYWARVRRYFPAIFVLRAEQSRRLGVRLCRYHGKRIFLDELPADVTDQTPEENIECGPICLSESMPQKGLGHE
jgi:3'-phosphoadenosine 5'-phosphosulfate sulfotransferase (PAPS reductase)/FAD synthetase